MTNEDERTVAEAVEAVPDEHEGQAQPATPQPDVDAGDLEPPPAETDSRSREELLTLLHEAETARDEYLDGLKRAQADFANFRKRTMREGASQRDAGVIEVLSQLIDVVDEFELAVMAADAAHAAGSRQGRAVSDVASLRKGVELVYGKFVDVLRSFGLEKIGAEGVPFDPELHEAVQQEEDGQDREQPIVAEVLRPGYAVGDRVLRPAMVKVWK